MLLTSYKSLAAARLISALILLPNISTGINAVTLYELDKTSVTISNSLAGKTCARIE